MPTEADRPELRINPRPGVVKALGICNIVFSVLSGFAILASSSWLFAVVASGAAASSSPNVVIRDGATNKNVVAFNPFMGMNNPTLIRFGLVNNSISVITTGLMFATGIGLINLRAWAARWWTYLAWANIGLAVLLWGYYIVGVAPGCSENMARNVAGMMPPGGGPGKGPTVSELTMAYSIMNLVIGVGMMILLSVYPTISLWLLGRPGVKAALIDHKPSQEPGLP